MDATNVQQPEKLWWMPEPYQKTVTLADGTVLNGYAGLAEAEKGLWIWLDEGTGMNQAIVLFMDPEKTVTIRTDLSPIDYRIYAGYTVIDQIRTDGNKVTIRMRQE